MAANERHKEALSTRGYFRRAKIFGYMLIISGVAYLLYYLFVRFFGMA